MPLVHKGPLLRDHRTQERFHFGTTDLMAGLVLSKCLISSEILGSDPISLPLPPPNLRVFDRADL